MRIDSNREGKGKFSKFVKEKKGASTISTQFVNKRSTANVPQISSLGHREKISDIPT